jgi:hypothetical protein
LIKNHLLPFFKEKKLREVQPSDISKSLQLKMDEQLAGKTLQNLYGLLRLMFDRTRACQLNGTLHFAV